MNQIDQAKTNFLNKEDNMTTITKRINGGTNGLQDRLNQFNRIKTFVQNT